MEGKQFLQARARVGAVIQRSTPAFQNLIGKKLDKFLVKIDKVVIDHLHDIGKKIVEAVQESMKNSGGGITYTYIENGEILKEHTASVPFMPPAVLTGDLMNAIKYKVSYGDQTVSVGVYNESLGSYKTIKYFSNYYFKKKGEKGEWIKNVVIVGESGTQRPISEYARNLEEEQDRPFIRATFENMLEEFKGDYRRKMREEVAPLFKGKTPPVYFRMYAVKF